MINEKKQLLFSDHGELHRMQFSSKINPFVPRGLFEKPHLDVIIDFNKTW